jgi:nucleolar protein 56
MSAPVIVTKWFGVFLCGEGHVRKYTLFEKGPKAIAEKLARVQRGDILPEEEQYAGRGVKVADARLSKLARPIVFDSSFIKAEAYGFTQELMQQVMVELGKLRTREPLSPDKGIVQAIRATDDLIETINIMSERIHEWYGLHFPELADYAADERYASLIARLGTREEVLKELQVELESVGAELKEEDVVIIRQFASSLFDLYTMKAALDAYIQKEMQANAPNLTALLSANLGARLISLAGGLHRLATLPAGTVQLLGAEKAMFMHLRSHKSPPKHGIIFQHPYIHKAPYWQRGKIARTIGAKAAIAARVDAFQGEFIGDKLQADLLKRVEEIKKKYPDPPKKERGPQPGNTSGRRPLPRGQYRRPSE